MDKAKGLHTYKPYYYNRELSWLKFNERVLDEAIDKEVPLCERLSFVSIFQSNLDEFFMVRVGTLTDQMTFSADARDNKTQMTAKEQLSEIFTSVGELLRKKDRAYLNLMSEIGEYGIELISFNDIEFADAVYLENYFKHSIMPLLSPQIVGKKQPFPFLRNKEIYAVALLKSKNSEKLGIVPCSSEVFKRLIPIPSDKNKYMLVEELILHFMPQIFSKYTIKSKSLIRIIRNADIDVDDAFYDEDLDYRNTMEKMIRERRKLCPVKMEYSRLLDEKVIVTLCKELKLNKDQIYYSEAPLSMSFISQIRDKLHGKKDLFYVRRVPQNSRYVRSSLSMMEQIEAGDILLSYPFESMQPFIRLLNEAGENEISDKTSVITPTQSPEPTVKPTIAPTTEPTEKPGETTKPGASAKNAIKTKKIGSELKGKNGVQYIVTSSKKDKPTVAYKISKKSKKSKIIIPKSVTVAGVEYLVTSIDDNAFKDNTTINEITIGKQIKSIGKNAFDGCENLKKIIIKSEKLKAGNVGKNAFANGSDKVIVKTSKKKLEAYKKLLKKRGISKNASFES